MIEKYVLKNLNGVTISLTNIGATVQSIVVPDKNGHFTDIALGYSRVEEYAYDTYFFGSTAGRYANRIHGGCFSLDRIVYRLPLNNGSNTLHGGIEGFNRKSWKTSVVTTLPDSSEDTMAMSAVRMEYTSADGEEGFPGNLTVKVQFTLTQANDLVIEYRATTDKTTVLNLTNHTYFNLASEGVSREHSCSTDILNHKLQIFADSFAESDAELIPTGRFLPVEGTPMDFRTPFPIGQRIEENYTPLLYGKGYDHSYCVQREKEGDLVRVARLSEPKSGRVVEVWTTEPDIHVYTGNFLNGAKGKQGHIYSRRSGVCLEAQHFPDSPNHPEFPTTVLNPGEEYYSKTVYRFMVQS